jgi:cation transport regulator
MPYQNIADLPEGVRSNLPEHAQEIYLAAYNNAVKEYSDRSKRRGNESLEEVARKVAWAGVEQTYKKDSKTGKWLKK